MYNMLELECDVANSNPIKVKEMQDRLVKYFDRVSPGYKRDLNFFYVSIKPHLVVALLVAIHNLVVSGYLKGISPYHTSVCDPDTVNLDLEYSKR